MDSFISTCHDVRPPACRSNTRALSATATGRELMTTFMDQLRESAEGERSGLYEPLPPSSAPLPVIIPIVEFVEYDKNIWKREKSEIFQWMQMLQTG